MCARYMRGWFFFLIASATPEIYTFSLHDALPIFGLHIQSGACLTFELITRRLEDRGGGLARSSSRRVMSSKDRKSTRLNSSHMSISYAVFCLKKTIPTQNTAFRTGRARGNYNPRP